MYEKLRSGIWSYNGLFHLVDSWQERSGPRTVFKFKLVAVVEESTASEDEGARAAAAHSIRGEARGMETR